MRRTIGSDAPGGELHLGGLSVSRLGYGTMQLPGPGVLGPPQDRAGARGVLQRAVELGITHIDTSAAYGPDIANDLIRESLHPYPDDLIIATKLGVNRQAGAWLAAGRPEQLQQQLITNLRSLGRDHLDLVYLRVGGDGLLDDDGTRMTESFGFLADQQRLGLIRCLGLSGVTVAQVDEARALAEVVAVQNRFNLLDGAAGDVLAACEANGIAFVPYFPLAAGLLKPGLDASRFPPGMAPTTDQAMVLDEIASRYEASRAQIAIAWLLAHSPSILAIPGTGSVAHLEENIAAANLRLADSDVIRLTELAQGFQNARTP